MVVVQTSKLKLKHLTNLMYDVKRSIAETITEQMREQNSSDLNVLMSNINGLTMTFIKGLIGLTLESEDIMAGAVNETKDTDAENAVKYLNERFSKLQEVSEKDKDGKSLV